MSNFTEEGLFFVFKQLGDRLLDAEAVDFVKPKNEDNNGKDPGGEVVDFSGGRVAGGRGHCFELGELRGEAEVDDGDGGSS